jgi:hypothetical protein
MRVCNPDRSPVGINRWNAAPTPTGFAEIVSDNSRPLASQRGSFCDDDDTRNCLFEAGAAPCCVYTLSELRILLEHHRRTPLSVHELLMN